MSSKPWPTTAGDLGRAGMEARIAELDAEIGRQQADIDRLMDERQGWLDEIEEMRALVADLTATLQQIKYMADDPVRIMAEAALTRAREGK